jgi:uncharacterized protein (DUF58 family)
MMTFKQVLATPRLLTILAVLLGLLLGSESMGLTLLSHLLLLAVALLLLLALLEGWQLRTPPRVTLTRHVPQIIPVNRPCRITLDVQWQEARATTITVFDAHPLAAQSDEQCNEQPLSVPVAPGVTTQATYQVHFTARGPFTFTHTECRLPGRFGLLLGQYAVQNAQAVRVYPDFSRIATYSVLAITNRVSQLGIRRKPRRGDGLEFHQLRPFRQGDVLKQVDWKATAKRQQLISREYQEERDQQIILLVDSGRRMRTLDGELSHFDHALNAMMLVCYIALQQGDSVGVLSFGSATRWLPPGKGAAQSSRLINGLYDLEVANVASDYVNAGEELLVRQQKRALVILLTNMRDENQDDLLALHKLLAKRHLLLLANIREKFLDDTQQVSSFSDALGYCGLRNYLQRRQTTHQALSAEGMHLLDCSADNLAITVANSYLELKSSGLL